ncbi:MAG: glycosyltransferase family 4 protein [Opitutaceae bacterium]
MRITIVQGAFFPVPPLLGGAVEKVWYGLGREFARRGHEVTHISRRHPPLPAVEVLEGVRHVRVSGFAQPRSLLLLKLKDLAYTLAVRRCLGPADIVVSNTFWLPFVARAPKYGKMVVHVARFPRGQMRHYRHAACLQAVSQPVAEAIRAELADVRPAPHVCVVPNPIAHRAPELPPPLERTPTVLYTGRLHPEKGLELLLFAWRRAAPHLPGWRLRIVGPWRAEQGGGGESYRELLRREAGCDPVDFVEPIFDPHELEREYRTASIFVYPSLALGESFGLAPLEAMAYGTPPIVSSLACFRDFIVPDGNGLVFDHGDGNAAGELAERLVRLGTEHETRAALGLAAWRTSERFTEKGVADAYLAEFAGLLGAPAFSRQ